MQQLGLWARSAIVTAAMVATWIGPRIVAQACGGTFCDAGPTAMPVEQTGETILFAVDDTHVEVHIQIEYDPDTEASQFAWVVPVSALPEFSIGSQELFARTLGATVPSYGFGNWNEDCAPEPDDDDGGDGFCDGAADEGNEPDDDSIKLDIGGAPPDGSPEVVLATTVGAFEVFVLDGGTVEGVMQWLEDNDFAQDEAAAPILGEYLAEGQLFVAFRLATEADVGSIHPIVLRYEGQEPCVPIRLTRIAAQDDMEIRALFLGDDRFASSNYLDVVPNVLKLDWLASGMNYGEVVSMAIDEGTDDGHGFVTEYAGQSSVVDGFDFVPFVWESEPFFVADSPTAAVELVRDLGLVTWNPVDGECASDHPLVDGLVDRYLPVPEDVPRELLCDDPLSYAAQVLPDTWDGEAFAAEFESRVLEPASRAEDLLVRWPYLTRLYTRLSPHEMTEDPMFHAVPEQPPLVNVRWIGTRNRFCDGHTNFSLPDGRLVTMPDGTWSEVAPEQMPWAERVAFLPARGAPVVELDNRPTIDAVLEQWHEEVGVPRLPSSSSTPLPPGCDGTGGGSSPATTGGQDMVEGRGCACRGGAPSGSAWWSLGLVVGWVARRRRR